MNNFGVMYVELLREFKVGKAEAGKRNDPRKKAITLGDYRKQDANEMICLLQFKANLSYSAQKALFSDYDEEIKFISKITNSLIIWKTRNVPNSK